MTTDDYCRWLTIYLQILGMQPDIAQRQAHGTSSTKFR